MPTSRSTHVLQLTVKPILSDEETKQLEGTLLPTDYFNRVIRKDADVYNENGELILRFRKKVLPEKHMKVAYDNIIHHARQYTSTRGIYGGPTDKKKLVQHNTKIRSNIMGYFDTISIIQKHNFREANMKTPCARQTSFTMNHPDKWKKIIPYIKSIDAQYKHLFPTEHNKQRKEALRTPYVIANTAFSTLTTNLNVQSAVHTDSGDYPDGFGNLCVLTTGTYTGGYTGFPKYGIAVDVRMGDFLGMNVHLYHANEPIIGKEGEYERLSIVSYLRKGFVSRCLKDKRVPSAKYFKLAAKKANENKSRRHKRKKTHNHKSRKHHMRKSRKL